MTGTDPQRYLDDSEELFSPTQVDAAVATVAEAVTHAVSGSQPLVLCVMRGATVFAGKLLPLLAFPLEFDYLQASRYQNTTSGGQELVWKALPGADLLGRTVLLLDDILDEGHTLAAVSEKCREAGADRILIAVLTEKDTGRPKPIRADFVGLTVPDRYVFGCGMDVYGWWRNLPSIHALKT
jgi:hypoxanthine phosphoribosyltransferase